ncbi:hypothetical protein AGLY_012425 [Aphis glycines]|uniref:HAT C-terminal dimerisation domain-containing protein n=1 Tax=Aphis glycines TaxID=307491 RepID=A0A6G0TA18_APHGL|nr:hypothetical protein AGLY_012425 [Aphis glycines]
MCICVRFFNPMTKKIESMFWSLVEVFKNSESANKGATAQKLYVEVIASFKDKKVNLDKVIGFASDGCNTMMGAYNSLANRFLEDFSGVIIKKFICHFLALCASEACKVLPRRCEDLARDVYYFFKSSCKRYAQLKEFQDFCAVEPHHLLRSCQSRWLSLELVVRRILEQWQPLKMFFTQHRFDERVTGGENIYNCLHGPFLLLFFKFLEWVLPKFVNLNKLFQSKKSVIAIVYSKMEETYTELLFSYMKKVHNPLDVDLDDSTLFLRSNDMYLGINVLQMTSQPDISSNKDMLAVFHDRCRQFLIEGCKQIKKRFDFKCAILKMITHLQPVNVLGNNKLSSLVIIFNEVPRILMAYNNSEIQTVDDEWRRLHTLEIIDDIRQTKNTDEFWYHLHVKNVFKNVAHFVLKVLSLPHSSVDCERIFSKVNFTKTKVRNKLQVPALNGLLLSSEHMKRTSCIKFKPTKSMINSINVTMYNKPTDVIEEENPVTDADA